MDKNTEVPAVRDQVGGQHRPHAPRSDLALVVLVLKERSGWKMAVVTLTNKNASIPWAVMTRSERFDLHHVSLKPGASAPA